MSLSTDVNLEQYRIRAKELLKQARSGAPRALDRIAAFHPEKDEVMKIH